MKMIKTTIALGALLSASMVFAQTPDAIQQQAASASQAAQTRPDNFNRNIDPSVQAAHLSKRLGLNSAQMIQIGLGEITPILTDRQQEMQALRADVSLSRQDRRTKAQAIIESTNSKIEAVLNDTEKQKFEQMLAERNWRQHNHQAQPQA